MSEQHHWLAAVSRQTYVEERLYAHDEIDLVREGDARPASGDWVALIAVGETPALFGLGRALGDTGTIRYTHRLLDEPVPLDPFPLDAALAPGGTLETGLQPITADGFARLAGLVADRHPDTGAGTRRDEWIVMAAIPIEAATAGDAVREFWSYVDKLGPRELPALVWPRGDEYAMQAFVLGEPANQDPEEDD